MEKLTFKLEKFEASLKAFDRSINIFSRKDIPHDIRENLVASLVKHFEMCYESSWKFLKIYLEQEYGLQVNSPKNVFRECLSVGLINEKTTKELLDISETRNSTTHDYNPEKATETCERIFEYYSTFKTLETIILESFNYKN